MVLLIYYTLGSKRSPLLKFNAPEAFIRISTHLIYSAVVRLKAPIKEKVECAYIIEPADEGGALCNYGHWTVVVVVLLLYVHGKNLRSCRDGQLT